MKVLALLFVIGCASASFYDALEDASDQVVVDFLVGMEKSPSLKEVVGFTYAEESDQVEEDIKTQLGKTLKETLEQVLSKIRVAVEHGKGIAKELLDKVKEITQKLKDIGQDAGSKAKELLERLKEKVGDWLKKVLESFNISKRSLGDIVERLVEKLNLKEIIENLKQKLFEKLNIEAIRDYVKKVFGELSATGEALLKALKEHGIQAVRDLITHILPKRIDEPKELEVKVIGQNHVEKRWIVIAKAACMLIKFMANGWTASKIQTWINNNIEPKWHGTLSAALKYGLPALKLVLGRFCYAAGPEGQVEVASYSLVDLWNKIKEYFKGIGIEIQERFFRFAEWLKGVVKTGVQDIQDKVEKLKAVAKQVIEHGKTLTKEVAEQAKTYFEPYKEDLGALWEELLAAINTALGRA